LFVVEMEGITKRFGAFVANDGIDLRVKRGRFTRCSGENARGNRR